MAEPVSGLPPAVPVTSQPSPAAHAADAAPYAPPSAAPAAKLASGAAHDALGTEDAANRQLQPETEEDLGPEEYDEY